MHPEWREEPLNGQDIGDSLKLYAPEVAVYLLPNGKRKGTHWHAGSTNGEAGDSLKLCLEGSDCGLWHDFATGDGGNLLTLWMMCRNMSFREALTDCAKWLGISTMCSPKSPKNMADEMYKRRKIHEG